jgi:hypothetical protein
MGATQYEMIQLERWINENAAQASSYAERRRWWILAQIVFYSRRPGYVECLGGPDRKPTPKSIRNLWLDSPSAGTGKKGKIS